MDRGRMVQVGLPSASLRESSMWLWHMWGLRPLHMPQPSSPHRNAGGRTWPGSGAPVTPANLAPATGHPTDLRWSLF